MNIIWGLIIAVVGALFITWGRTKSDLGLYRLLVARSRVLWGAGHSPRPASGGFIGAPLFANGCCGAEIKHDELGMASTSQLVLRNFSSLTIL